MNSLHTGYLLFNSMSLKCNKGNDGVSTWLDGYVFASCSFHNLITKCFQQTVNILNIE